MSYIYYMHTLNSPHDWHTVYSNTNSTKRSFTVHYNCKWTPFNFNCHRFDSKKDDSNKSWTLAIFAITNGLLNVFAEQMNCNNYYNYYLIFATFHSGFIETCNISRNANRCLFYAMFGENKYVLTCEKKSAILEYSIPFIHCYCSCWCHLQLR